MSLAQNSNPSLDLSKSEEFLYQTSEQKYHLQNVSDALKEAIFHLKRSEYHASLANSCKKT
jgi:hypothetical protein